MIILDGKKTAAKVQSTLKQKIEKIPGRKPKLVAILVGENIASQTYVKRKTMACQEVGIHSHVIELEENIDQKTLLSHIETLNADDSVDGILVQLPLPKTISQNAILQAINPNKDVDGFHPINMGKLLTECQDGFIPCTPLGIQMLLEEYHIETKSKNVLIIGRSTIVGKPLSALLLQRKHNATVTVAHSQTRDLKALTLKADIIISAVGQPKLVLESMVQTGTTIIDVGISKSKEGRLIGDVDFENVCKKCAYITPVPGGVGPMTVAALLSNTLKSREAQ